MPIPDELRIARHEAAHAVAALEVGGEVNSIDLAANLSPTGLGATKVSLADPNLLNGEERDQALLMALIVYVAGAANDALELREQVELSWAAQSNGDGQAATALFDRCNVPQPDRTGLIDKALQAASELVYAKRDAIISIADLVKRKGKILDREIKRRYASQSKN